MEFTINLPHSLGAKEAAEKLQDLDDLVMRKCVVESEGKVKGRDVRTTTTITADNVSVRVNADLPWLVPEFIVKGHVESKILKALNE